MPYPTHYLVAFGGHWQDTDNEVWQCGIRGVPTTGDEDFNPDTWLSDVQADLADWYGTAANGMATVSRLDWVKCNQIGPDGKYVDPTTHVHDYTSPVAGGKGLVHSGDNSLVFTWGTARSRPPGAFGRIYPPNPTYAMASTFTVADTDRDAAATAAVALLEVLRNVSGTSGQEFSPCVVSKVLGEAVAITHVTVDDIYDVQRRRKNRVVGDRSTPIPFP